MLGGPESPAHPAWASGGCGVDSQGPQARKGQRRGAGPLAIPVGLRGQGTRRHCNCPSEQRHFEAAAGQGMATAARKCFFSVSAVLGVG